MKSGSGILVNHPAGAMDSIATAKAPHEMHRMQGRYALVTTRILGGQGIATTLIAADDWSSLRSVHVIKPFQQDGATTLARRITSMETRDDGD